VTLLATGARAVECASDMPGPPSSEAHETNAAPRVETSGFLGIGYGRIASFWESVIGV
jgi:hypothetical protein